MSNFYEVLGIQANASPADVRKAYRKKALQTHPDRLPPGALPEDKQVSEEKFRKVNHAYEVLIDPKNRKLYDMYGVWPPPEEFPEAPRRERDHRSDHRSSHPPFPGPDPFGDFFNRSPFGDPFTHRPWSRPSPAFRDPFELFNTTFADMLQDLYYGPSPLFFRPSDSLFGRPDRMFRGFEARPSLFTPMPMFRPLLGFPDFPPFPDEHQAGSSRAGPHREVFSFESASRDFYGPNSGSGRPQWVSEKRMVRTVNGVTQSVWKRRDLDGNEHVTYTYPDGREQYMLNGVEQPHPTYHIQDSTSATSVNPQYAAPQPVIPPDTASTKKRWWGRH